MTENRTPCPERAPWLPALMTMTATILALAGGASTGWAQGAGPSAARPGDAPAAADAATAAGDTAAGDTAADTRSADSADTRSADSADTSPWSVGVSPEDRARAVELYQAGNAALDDSLWQVAARSYREALGHWDHPGIHYNLALALVNLDQPIPAYRSIVAALRHGAEGLEAEQYQQALMYRLVLRRQVAEIEVSCDVEGAVVTLDGKPLFTGPGRIERMIGPGAHQLIAHKQGHADDIQTVVATPDAVTRVDMRPLAPVELPLVRRWDWWKPWLVVGAGALIGVGGLATHAGAADYYRRADERLASSCPDGCYPGTYPPVVDELERQGDSRRTLAWTSYALGGVVIAAGVALVYFNRPHPVSPESLESAPSSGPAPVAPGRAPRTGGTDIQWHPLLTPETRGVAMRLTF